jgi:NADPH-ferrihemoprotein reductase
MTNPSPMLDTLDIVFLGTIGLGTVAWFARKQLFGRFGGASDSKSAATTATKTAPPIKRKERNFVKVMQDQVCNETLMMFLRYPWVNGLRT